MAVSSQRISAAYRYGIALGAVVMAAAIRAALEPVLGQEALYLPFLLAVLLVGRFEGHGPAFLATGLSTICTAWLFLAPWHSFSIASPAARVGLALFVVIGIAMSILTGNVRTSLLSASETAETLRKHIRMLNPQPEGGDAFRQVLPERDTKEKRGSSFRAKLKRTPHFLWLGLAALAIVLQAGSFWSMWARFSGREQWSVHTHQVLEKIESLLSTLNEAEARQRGYLLTGDERGLTPYRESLEEIPPRLDDLQELTSDNLRL